MSQHTGSRLKIDSIVFYYDIDDYTGTSSWFSKIGPNMSVNGTVDHRETTNRQYLELDGSTANLELNSYLSSLSEITINAWISCDPLSSEVVICCLNNMVLSISQNSEDSNLIDINWYSNYSSSSKTYAGVTVSRRSHALVSVTQDSSGNVKFYINGELKSSQSGAAALSNTQTYKHIGSLGGSSKFFKGAISRLIVNNEVLSDVDISNIYKTNPDLLLTQTYDTTGQDMIAIWNTDSVSGRNAFWPYHYASKIWTFDWGDGTVDTSTGGWSHTYNENGKYVVRVSAPNNDFYLYAHNFGSDNRRFGWEKIPYLKDKNIYYIGLRSLSGLKKIPPDINSVTNYIFGDNWVLNDPNVSDIQSLGAAIAALFYNCFTFNQPINHWDVSHITSLGQVFYNCREFNQPLNDWDLSNNTSLYQTFQDCWRFNQPLDNWNTSGVTNMEYTFQNCYSFDQDLSSWDTSNVTKTTYLFRSCYNLGLENCSLSGWDTSNVTHMAGMFTGTRFVSLSGISEFDTSSATTMNNIFSGATSFNQDIGDWDVGNVTDMYQLLYVAYYFDQDLSGWDVSSVNNFGYAFYQTGYYQSKPLHLNISGWDVSNATSMYSMFGNCRYFDENLGSWNLASLNASNSLFNFMYGVALSSSNYDSLLNGWNNNKLASANGVANWRTDLSPHFGGSKYTSAGSAARQALINYGWTITDGGLQT